MTQHRVAGSPLDFADLRRELQVPADFPPEALAEAAALLGAGAVGGAVEVQTVRDATDIPLVTIDPPGSMDLDQAVHLAAHGDGHLVTYAIADVASFVRPGGCLDAEAHRRGETFYFPDARVPLHPAALSEGAASLLPDVERPAVLWQITLDAGGEVSGVSVERARVRSRARLDYAGVQAMADAGTLPAPIEHLPVVGARRMALARARHAIDLDLPEQLVVADGRGGWTIELRGQLPVERWNAEISLLTGMCAARLMLDAGFGILRTVPPPSAGAVQALRRAAAALGIQWPEHARPGDVLDSVNRTEPTHMAFVEHALALLRGSDYVAFDGAAPEQPLHSGIGAPYTHVTAPLRRLVDRYSGEICLAVAAGRPVPQWVRDAAPGLPDTMRSGDQLARAVDRAVVDATEAWLLSGRVGELFAAVVIDADARAGTIVLDQPAVRARCAGTDLPVGSRITARLISADVARREVRFERDG